MYEIHHYLTLGDERDLYVDWLERLRDTTAKISVVRRVTRIEQGNFGDHKFCRDGVWELRIDVGAGYRVYYAVAGKQVVLLLCGGDKRTQDADTGPVSIGRTGKGDLTMKSRAHDDAMADLYLKDPKVALQVINNILEDGDQGELLIVLRQMTKVFGGVQTVADKAHLNPTQLYRTLSPTGNPALSSFSAILKAMGLRLAVQPIQAPHAHA